MMDFTQLSLLAQAAATDASPGVMDDVVKHLAAAVVFAVVGGLILGGGFFLILKLSPFSVRKEIEEDQNISLAIIIGSMILGLALIIAAAIHG